MTHTGSDRPEREDDFGGLLGDSGAYVIAEAGVNHSGNAGRAHDLVDIAADAGADAVKFQTFDADRLVARTAPKAAYQRETDDADGQYEMLERLELPRSVHRELLDHCVDRGVQFLSTPFDRDSATFLHELDPPAIKLGSGELDNLPLLRHVASFGRPMIVSTGMGTLEEVETAVDVVRRAGDPPVALLQCTSAYPCPLDEANIRAMRTMAETFDVPVGFSDHTMAVETPALAVAAGARIVEKHFTLDRSLSGPDHAASLEPDELERAVELVRDATTALGDGEKGPTKSELENRKIVRKSLHAATSVDAGEPFVESNVSIVRPATGLAPAAFETILGQQATNGIEQGEPITAADVEGIDRSTLGSYPEVSNQ